MWVGVKILVVNNLLPAREFMIIIPLNGLFLVSMIIFMLTASTANIEGAVTDTIESVFACLRTDTLSVRFHSCMCHSALFRHAISAWS